LISDQAGTVGIYLSSNNGENWENANFNLSSTEYNSVSQLVSNKLGTVCININFQKFYRFDFDNRKWLLE